MRQTANNAFGSWPGILTSLGVDAKFLRDAHGPCPKCGGTDRYRFDDKGTGSFFCSRCGAGDGFKLLELVFGWPFAKAADEVDKIIGAGVPKVDPKPERTEADKREYMRLLWKGSRPVVQGDPVWLYLERRCGASPAPFLQDIRFHPALKHSVDGGTHPAMLAMMGWDGTRFNGVHRTYLTQDGQKAAVDPVRMTYGDMGPVRLGPAMERMGIAEGLETAICASLRFGVPVWSAICAEGLKGWAPPQECRSVMVFGDNDASYTGQEAAMVLARRLAMADVLVEVHIPPMVGTDWADAQIEMVA